MLAAGDGGTTEIEEKTGVNQMENAAHGNAARVLTQFQLAGEVVLLVPYGNGHINDTYLVETKDGVGVKRYILQRINSSVFRDPLQLMDNMERVTAHVSQRIRAEHGDEERGTLRLLQTRDGTHRYLDETGACWRTCYFIEDSLCLERPEQDGDFYQSAVAFGRFQRQLLDFPAEQLHETIPDFHNTPKRLAALRKAVRRDRVGRAADVERELAFCFARAPFADLLLERHAQGELPLRVTHNDTKLNNVMLDRATRTALCVIDLDTVMPGFSVTDFGDSIRFGASTAAEDEPDLERVCLSLPLFEQYTEGFLHGCEGLLTDAECALLPEGAKMMALECGIRFLTDYLDGDRYFKISRPDHNLLRCRTQLRLVQDMEDKWADMKAIVAHVKGGVSQ